MDRVYHLAALLSTRTEFTPVLAHKVNVEGTLNLLEFAQKEAETHGRPVEFLYPSSIAAFGLPDLDDEARPAGSGGRLQLSDDDVRRATSCTANTSAGTTRGTTSNSPPRRQRQGGLPVRAVSRADLGGDGAVGRDSDYAPEMIHAAAGGEPYECFVRPDTRIPFMAMPDAVEAILR